MAVFKAIFRGRCTDPCPQRDPTLDSRSCHWGLKVLIIFGKRPCIFIMHSIMPIMQQILTVLGIFWSITKISKLQLQLQLQLSQKRKFWKGGISNVFSEWINQVRLYAGLTLWDQVVLPLSVLALFSDPPALRFWNLDGYQQLLGLHGLFSLPGRKTTSSPRL